jgi:guanylate kinase
VGETDGVQYHFLTDSQFDSLIDQGEFLEHATFAGSRYGTPRKPVDQHLAAGRPTLLEIELQGARQVRASMPQAQFVFLAPPSFDELRGRLVGRGTEPSELVEARLMQARVELAAEPEFDLVVINDDVERAASELVVLIESGTSSGR